MKFFCSAFIVLATTFLSATSYGFGAPKPQYLELVDEKENVTGGFTSQDGASVQTTQTVQTYGDKNNSIQFNSHTTEHYRRVDDEGNSFSGGRVVTDASGCSKQYDSDGNLMSQWGKCN